MNKYYTEISEIQITFKYIAAENNKINNHQGRNKKEGSKLKHRRAQIIKEKRIQCAKHGKFSNDEQNTVKNHIHLN